MITYTYSRREALEQGLRDTTEINKDYYKRPILMISKKRINLEEVVKELTNNFPVELVSKKTRMLGRDQRGKEEIELSELDTLKNFKKKTIHVYVEKQDNNIYTLREFKMYSQPVIREIKIENSFYDIAGKTVHINLSRKKGVYTVHYIY